MKLGKIAKDVLGKVAPTVAMAVGGPFGGLAASLLQTAFGTDDEAEIERQLATSNPDALLKARSAQKEFEVKMRELDIREDDLFLKDVQSARETMVSTSMLPQLSLAGLFVGGYFIILVGVLSGSLTPASSMRDMAMILIGVLTGEVPRIMAFFFGSTKGSSDKNAFIAKLSEQLKR